ncbi:MAG: 5-(carboxyamino)imidazole ribonucleotide mutase [Candidatus Omnitrophica bacterium]|nr:5-(carboxyamino)imidazole ribonucleotide mutase [Candidatus Omnitrophota bacterium]MDD5311117.1 5-(carboxyamino)imidazole ribonucleotide mutase [Candidatus Omnitrophota bacterium]
MTNPRIAVILGSDSDLPAMEEGLKVLKDFKVTFELKIMSAHRSPDLVHDFARSAEKKGIKVVIAAAGGAAHLAGVIASLTRLPVVGVPMETSSLNGMDSLFSTVQMPYGVPVATMAIGKSGARNASIFALQILALSDKKIAGELNAFKRRLEADVIAKNKKLKI